MRISTLFTLILAGCIFGPDHPKPEVPGSIAQALTMRPDEFPAPYLVVVPPIAGSALGYSFEPATIKNGRAQIAAARCFYVAPIEEPSLSKIEIEYKASAEVAAELDQIAVNAGLKVKDNASASLVLEQLRRRRSVSLPNFAACNFEEGASDKRAITQEIVATTASLDFSHAFSFDTKLSAPQLQAKLQAGWVSSEQGALKGNGILMAAKEQDVHVTVETKTLSWPDAKSSDVPFTPMGKITIDSYNEGVPAIKLIIDMSAKGKNPTDIQSCKTGSQGMTLGHGESCMAVFDEGNSGLFVTWDEDGAGKAKVTVRGFRTNFDGDGKPAVPKNP